MVLGFFRERRERRVAMEQYREALNAVLADDHLSDAEAARLDEVARALGLAAEDRTAQNIEACKALWLRVNSDKRITAEETANFERALTLLGVTKEQAGFDQLAFNRGVVLASMESGAGPPAVENIGGLPIQKKPGEAFHWACPAALCRWKARVTRVNYAGPTVSIRIMKGVRYRLGSFAPQVSKAEYLGTEDAGYLWMSSQRLGFHGNRKSFAIPWGRVAAFEATPNGLRITKEGKETPYILIPDDFEVPCAIASWIMNRGE